MFAHSELQQYYLPRTGFVEHSKLASIIWSKREGLRVEYACH